MSKVIIEHPVAVIEDLLKLGIGDEGRLLYLRKAITNGKTVYDSDKKFLKRMYEELDKTKSEISGKHNDRSHSGHTGNKSNTLTKNKYEISKANENSQSEESYSGITKIQNLIDELKKSDSRVMDNLELLLISREITTQSNVDKSNSFGSFSKFSNNNADLFDLLKNDPVSKNSQLFGFKKYHIMAYATAGLFALSFAGFQSMIDLGPIPSVALGLSAGTALIRRYFLQIEKKLSKKTLIILNYCYRNIITI